MPAPQPRWMQAPPAPQQDAQPKWMQAPPVGQQPAQSGKPPPGMVFDPLAPAGTSGFVPAPKPPQDPIAPRSQWTGGLKATLDTVQKPQPWNEGVADILQAGADFLLAPLEARNAGPNDLVGDAAKMVARGTAELPAAVFRDPNQAIKDYDPFHQLGYGYNNMVDAGGDVIERSYNTAGAKAAEGANQLAMGALGLAGVRTKPSVPRNALAVEPTLRETGKTLAATAVPGRKTRPQAMDALGRILLASNVPRDRVTSGLAKVVKSLEEGASLQSGGSVRAPTVAQLLEREFAEEFPEVAQNIRTVLLERRLSNKPKDSSSTIIRDAAQEMRQSQVPFLDESASANLGSNSRLATSADVEANLRQIGEEGYAPIVNQRAEPQRARQIQDVLNGPGMNELGRPLRQIAAGEGVDIDVMIAQRPIQAAHWMQHKARLLASENEGTALGNAYNNMRSRILKTIDDLETPDGQTYAQIRARYGDEAGIRDALSAGDRFGAIVRNPDGANRFVEAFKSATPEQQAAQLASIRDWAQSKLRGGGEGGTARMTELKNIAVLDTLEKLGAQGKALADDIRAVRDEEQFLGSFYPNAESATARNLLATGQGADLYSRPGASSMPVNALADAALMGSGLAAAPIMTAMRQGPKLYRGIMQPRTATREDMTRVLMSRPKAGERVLASRADNATPQNALNVTPPPAPSGPPMNALAPAAARLEPPPLVMPEAQQIGRWEGPVPQKPQSLLAWVRGQGGIKDRNYMSGDLKALMGRANAMPGLLNNQSGKGLDDIVAAAYEQGFDVDPNDANSLMRLIEEEIAGNPSYRIGAREEWDIYQEYLAARRGDLSEDVEPPPTPQGPPVNRLGMSGSPEAIGAAGGTAIGMATAPDQNGDGVVDAQERMMGGAGGALTGGIAGRGVRGGMNALAPKPAASSNPPPVMNGFGGGSQNFGGKGKPSTFIANTKATKPMATEFPNVTITPAKETRIPMGYGQRGTVTTKDGKGKIEFSVTERGDVRVLTSEIKDEARGKGLGLEMYEALAQYASSNRKALYSDAMVSGDAVKVYMALKRRGYNVRLANPDDVYENPNYRPSTWDESKNVLFPASSGEGGAAGMIPDEPHHGASVFKVTKYGIPAVGVGSLIVVMEPDAET
jgi:hypothetical protein